MPSAVSILFTGRQNICQLCGAYEKYINYATGQNERNELEMGRAGPDPSAISLISKRVEAKERNQITYKT